MNRRICGGYPHCDTFHDGAHAVDTRAYSSGESTAASISTSIVMSGMIAIGIVGFAIDALLRQLEAHLQRRRGRN